jgi:hypothetical protein
VVGWLGIAHFWAPARADLGFCAIREWFSETHHWATIIGCTLSYFAAGLPHTSLHRKPGRSDFEAIRFDGGVRRLGGVRTVVFLPERSFSPGVFMPHCGAGGAALFVADQHFGDGESPWS